MPSVRSASPFHEDDSLLSTDTSTLSSPSSSPSSSPLPSSVTDVRGSSSSSSSPPMSSSRDAQLNRLLDQTSLYSRFLSERMPTRYNHSMKLFTSSSERRRARTTRTSPPTTTPIPAAAPDTVSDSRYTSLNSLLAPGLSLFMYQAVGVDWLISLFENGLNGVIADEMGLGKTLQCIVLLAHLQAHGIPGPYIIIAPLSTLSSWEAEFHRWTPQLSVVRYHGTPPARKALRESIFSTTPHPIVITSYEIALHDAPHLRHHQWKLMVVDEGHRLKNYQCKLLQTLKSFPTENRLLLTGTPLQNNLRELWSLLNFLLPSIFDSLQRFEKWFDFDSLQGEEGRDALLMKEKNERIVSKLHDILHPFVLRRLKVDVLQLPRKREWVVLTPMKGVQGGYYRQIMERKLKALQDGRGGLNMRNIFIQLQKVCDSPYLITRAHWMDDADDTLAEEGEEEEEEEEEEVEEKEGKEAKRRRMASVKKSGKHQPTDAEIHADLVQSCGKMQVVDSVLRLLHRRRGKVLIFSGMVRMLDLLATFIECGKYGAYIRIDGSTPALDRHSQVLSFNASTPSSPCIALLSTRAAGLGLNLASASTVILYDSDWNPQMDLQAQDRAHRLGSTHEVTVLRLLTPASVEMGKWERAQQKTVLSNVVMPRNKFKGEEEWGGDSRGGGAAGEKEFLEDLKRMFDREQSKLRGEVRGDEAEEEVVLSKREKREAKKEEERKADEANIIEGGRKRGGRGEAKGRKRKVEVVGVEVDAEDVKGEEVMEAQQVTDEEVALILDGQMTGEELKAHSLIQLVDDDQGAEEEAM